MPWPPPLRATASTVYCQGGKYLSWGRGTKWKKEEGALLLHVFRVKTSRRHLGVFFSPSPGPPVSLLSSKLSALDKHRRSPGPGLRRFLCVSAAITQLGCRVAAVPAGVSSPRGPSALSGWVPAGSPVWTPSFVRGHDHIGTSSMQDSPHDLNLMFLSI